MLLVNGSVQARKGVNSAFRKHLNQLCADAPKHRNKGDAVWKQRTRGYGDYLYFQDRPKFEMELQRALQGEDFPDFERQRWLVPTNV